MGALLFTLVSWVTNARAADDPTLTWWTLETAHFRVTFPHTLEPVARRVATLSESIHGRLTEGMAYTPEDKTHIVLTDDTDGANGSATPIPYDTIRLYVTAPGDISTLGDYDDWLLGLITHEYTHILHTGNISGLASVANRIIGRTLAPNSAQPRWVIEGLAVVLESEYTSGGRVRSSLFDAYLRADVLADNVARLDQISSGAERWPYGNLFYLYGSRFLRWVTDIYGPDTMPAVSADYGAATVPWGINRAIRRVTGRTYEDLYGAWVLHLKAHYGAQVKEVDRRGRREGTRVTFGGHGSSYPRFVPPAQRQDPAREEVIYFRDDYSSRIGFYRFALGDLASAEPRDEELFVRTSTEGAPAFAPDGELLFANVDFFKNTYARLDLFQLPRGESGTTGTELTRKRLTKGLRAHHPDVSPDGRKVVFTVNHAGTTTLSIADRDAEGALTRVRTLVRGKTFDQAYTPRFSPDGKHVVFSAWSAGGFRDIRLVDLANGKVRDLTRDRSLDMQPTWSSDGSTIYFSSDRTGIFNVYAMTLATGETKMVTNVVGAALAPAVSSDGKTLLYLGYTHEGFDVFAMKLDPARFLAAPAAPEDRPRPQPEPPAVKMEKRRYNPLSTLRPQSYFLEVGPGNYSSTAVTFTASGADLVGHHGLDATIRFDPGAPEPRVSLGYSYGGLPVDLSLSMSRQVVPRPFGFRVSGLDVPFDETQTSVRTSVSASLRHPFVSQALSLSYSATAYQSTLRLPPKLDPFETITTRPDEGLLSQFRFDYALSSFDSSTRAAGGTHAGGTFRVGASLADENTGSTTALYQFDASASAYLPMPWPGHHTLAMRASGGIAGGRYATRGAFFVGGYDLDSNGPLETLIEGAYDGAFVLRGYPAGSFAGSAYLLSSIEYRAPIVTPNWGPSSMPIFLRRIDASVFADWGGAFDELELERFAFFKDGELLYSPDLHSAVGIEAWANFTLAHRVDTNLRLGYAYGFGDAALEYGQVYVISSSAF